LNAERATSARTPLLRRKWLIATLGAVVALALAVLLAPVYLRGVVRNAIEREVGARVNGTVSVGGVRLGWFSPQRVESLVIQGDDSAGSITLTAEVAQGLVELATGDAIDVSLSGRVQTAIDADGRAGLARLRRSEAVPAQPAPAPAPNAAQSGKQRIFGGRTIRIELAGIDLEATRDGKPLYAVNDLAGWIGLEGTDVQGLKVNGQLKAATAIARADGLRAGNQAGTFEGAFIVLVPQRVDGSFGTAGLSGSLELNATNLPVPSSAGQSIVAEQLSVTAMCLSHDTTLSARGQLRAGDEQPSKFEVDVSAPGLFDAQGAFALDPASVKADVTVEALPLAVMQPYAPEIREGVRLDFVEDVGQQATLRVAKDAGQRASIAFDAQRVKFNFDATFASDGSSIDGGTLDASVSVRPELLRALGVDASGPLVAFAKGSGIAWRKAPPGGSAGANAGGALESIGGVFSIELAQRLGVRGAFEAAGEKVDVRADTLRATLEKQLGTSGARLTSALDGVYGAQSAVRASLAGDLDLATKSMTGGMLDATLALDAVMVERLTKNGVSVARGGSSAKLTMPAFAYRPGEGRSALESLEAKGRLEVQGDLLVTGGKSVATVRGLGVNFALPTAGAAGEPGLVDLSARIDGAETRITQRFAAIPLSFDDPAALGLGGTIDVRGLDPSVVGRFAPAAKDSLGILGAGPMTLSARNRTEAGAIVADFTLDAVALDASGSARYAKDSFSASNLLCDAALTPELLAAIKVPDSVSIARGARASVRVPTFVVAKGPDGWAPAGDIAARVAVDRLRVERAPGLKASLDVPRIEADATYAMKDDRATAKGFATLGAGGAAGRLGYDIVWTKPVEAKLFRGLEGTLALTAFDLARLESALGLEPGGYSGVLGGAGDCTVELRERDAAQAKVALQFPKTRGDVAVEVKEEGRQRFARATGRLEAQIAPDAFAALAGLANDPKRRVVAPVEAKLDVKSARVPLDAELKPLLADSALDVSGTLSAVGIEVTDARGQKTAVSTGPLSLALAATRLSEELTLRIVGDGKTGAAPAQPAGALQLDARVRGAVARAGQAKATPIVDATAKATKFPAATIDALAGTRGAVARYMGDAIDADLVAVGLSTAPGSIGSLSAKIDSPFASVAAPALSIADGFLKVDPRKPMTATFTLSPEVREQLLTPINPVFSDVTSKERARFTLSSLAWPLDGDRRKFDAAFVLETGEIALTNSGSLASLLSLLQAGRTEGFEAQIDPLRATISKGRLTYRDFALRVGKTQQGSWRNSLLFSGDIDLAANPIYANEITTRVPLSDAANWSSDVRRLLDRVSGFSPELLKSLTVGVKLSGPVFDASGKPAKLKQELALPDIGELLRRDPGAVIEGAGGILESILNRRKNK
jgi:hypothetical protein